MKHSRSDVRRKAHAIPDVTFAGGSLTAYAGLVVFQKFFTTLKLKDRLRACLRCVSAGKVFAPATVFLQLIVHLLLGYRELQHSRCYQDDPLVQRLLGLQRLPNVATLSRMLKAATAESVAKLRTLLRQMVLQRLTLLAPSRPPCNRGVIPSGALGMLREKKNAIAPLATNRRTTRAKKQSGCRARICKIEKRGVGTLT